MAERPVDGFLYKNCLSFDEINTAGFTVNTWSLLFKQFFHSHVFGYSQITPLHGWLSAISHPMLGYG